MRGLVIISAVAFNRLYATYTKTVYAIAPRQFDGSFDGSFR